VDVEIDDATRLAYVEVLPDEQQATAIGFLTRAVAWFNGQGVLCRQVMSENGPACLSRSFAKACKALGLKHICTWPYTPRTNEKADRFIQTLCKGWAYSMDFQNSLERDNCLKRYLSIHNRLRKHSALGGRSPNQRLKDCSSDQRGVTKHLGVLLFKLHLVVHRQQLLGNGIMGVCHQWATYSGNKCSSRQWPLISVAFMPAVSSTTVNFSAGPQSQGLSCWQGRGHSARASPYATCRG
jgi:hypothetical protein